MPSEVIAELKHVLKKESSGYGDNACKAFMLAMVSMIGGYRKALKFREVRNTQIFMFRRKNVECNYVHVLHTHVYEPLLCTRVVNEYSIYLSRFAGRSRSRFRRRSVSLYIPHTYVL